MGAEMLILTALPAFAPAISDAIRGIVGRIAGATEGVKPQSVDEGIRLMQAETERLKALKDLDAPAGNISAWVADLRASFRYVAAGAILLTAVVTLFVRDMNPAHVEMAWQGAQSAWSFIFGDRMYAYIRKR
ncbi:MAG: hypothetical protein HY894_00385 [Deltaproteobacteria bacterium]|nr:hypothetical protein [Deltaproteobacteria bacterium]